MPVPARVLAAGLVLCCILVSGLGSPARAADDAEAVSGDADVIEAREQLQTAEGLVSALAADLDEAAGRYEHANAHQLRLEDEASDSHAQVARARTEAEEAEDAFARGVAAAYKRPHLSIALTGALLRAPDTQTALERASMLQQLADSQRLRADRAQKTVSGEVEAVRNEQVVTAGARGAAEESQRLAGELEATLVLANDQVSSATANLADQEQAAQERIAEERRKQEEAARAARVAAQAAQAAQVFASSGPLPPIDGKVCPIGAPNGFIDSWGFPRSGGRAHKGVDMFAAHGMPLYAVADGHIARVFNNRLGGLSINLIDGDGHRYYYAHLSAVSVSNGQQVSAGQVIGANGNSGNARSTPPHLHWQYHPHNGPPVSPYPLALALCR